MTNLSYMTISIYFIISSVKICNVIGNIYPPSWNNVCVINTPGESKQVDIKCILSGNDSVKITLYDLDEFAQNSSEIIAYSVSISCVLGGNLSMSIPMKITKLRSLKVSGCDIYDFLKDWNNPDLENTEDFLEYEHIIDCTVYYHLGTLIEVLEYYKNSSNIQYKEWLCGSDESIKEIIYRNFKLDIIIPIDMLSPDFPFPTDTATSSNTYPFPDISPNLDNFDPSGFDNSAINDIIDITNPSCRFPNLEVIEESGFDISHGDHLLVTSKSNNFPNLRILNYSNNGIQWLPDALDRYFDKFGKRSYIDYSYNRISEVKLRQFTGWSSDMDTVIDVRYNNITMLTLEQLRRWSNLQNTLIDIRGNPLDCGCAKQQFIFGIRSDSFFEGDLLKYKYIRDMACASPESARGVSLSKVTKGQMGCSSLTVQFAVLSVSAIVVIVVIILMFRFRKEIKIILFIRFNILFPWDKDDTLKDKKFDAFMSYSSADGDWVHGYLQKQLECPVDNAHSFKLCLHERDFVAGNSILYNITESIENSRYTVVILSKNFVKSMWALAEFKEAYEESITKKCHQLIIVKLEEVPEDDLDSTLKRCLKTFTYLDVKNSMFVDRLRFSLAIKNSSGKNSKRDSNS